MSFNQTGFLKDFERFPYCKTSPMEYVYDVPKSKYACIYHHTILDNLAPEDKNQTRQTFTIETSIFFSLIQVMLLKQGMTTCSPNIHIFHKNCQKEALKLGLFMVMVMACRQ